MDDNERASLHLTNVIQHVTQSRKTTQAKSLSNPIYFIHLSIWNNFKYNSLYIRRIKDFRNMLLKYKVYGYLKCTFFSTTSTIHINSDMVQ